MEMGFVVAPPIVAAQIVGKALILQVQVERAAAAGEGTSEEAKATARASASRSPSARAASLCTTAAPALHGRHPC